MRKIGSYILNNAISCDEVTEYSHVPIKPALVVCLMCSTSSDTPGLMYIGLLGFGRV